MRDALALLTLFVSSTLLVGCIDENEAVIFVEPSVPSKPSANITGSVLGSTIKGSFQLRLVLGPRASDSSSVTLNSVIITDASQKMSIGPTLSVTSSKSFPLTLEPGSEMTLDATFDIGESTVGTGEVSAYCDPAGIRIDGSIGDSLTTGATFFASDPFTPTGCP